MMIPHYIYYNVMDSYRVDPKTNVVAVVSPKYMAHSSVDKTRLEMGAYIERVETYSYQLQGHI